MRVLVCDDEAIICNAICQMIREFFEEEEIENANVIGYLSGEELLSDRGTKDIVFLDVRLGGKDGIEVGTELKRRNPKVIIFLITAYEEYTDDAFRMEAFRFFMKPFDKERLFANMREAMQLYYSACGKICVDDNKSIVTRYQSDIIFVESYKRGSIIHSTEGIVCSSQNIDQWKRILNQSCFVRTHRSYIVNMEYVAEIDKDTIKFHNYDKQAFLTRRKYKEFKNEYMDYLKYTSAYK